MTKGIHSRLSEDGKRVAAIERQRDRLAEALRELIAAQFSAERLRRTSCGQKLEDAEQRLIEADMSARAALAELEKP